MVVIQGQKGQMKAFLEELLVAQVMQQKAEEASRFAQEIMAAEDIP